MNEENKSPKRMKRRISLRRAQKESTAVVTGSSMESGTKMPEEEEDIGLNILQLPEMVMVDIFSFLPVKDKCRSTRVCKTFRRLMKDSSLWKCVDLTQYAIKLRDLTKVTRRYLSKSLKHLELKGFLCTTVKTKLLSEVFLEELRARSPNLSKLVIYNAELRTLPSSKLPKSLQHLHLQSCQLREGWLLPALQEGTLTNLRSLDLSGCGRITNRDISPMSKLKNLEELSLLGCYRLGDQALEAITADHPNLKSLLIGHSDFTDVGMQDVSLNMKRLERFSIQHCELVTNKSLRFIQRMKTIEELDISYNPQFDDASIYGLVKGLPNLRKITVHDVTTVSDTIMQINSKIEVL